MEKLKGLINQSVTSDLVDNSRIIAVKPRAIFLQALGGYSLGQEGNARLIDEELARLCIQARLVILPNNKGTLDFVSVDDLPELLKNLKSQLG